MNTNIVVDINSDFDKNSFKNYLHSKFDKSGLNEEFFEKYLFPSYSYERTGAVLEYFLEFLARRCFLVDIVGIRSGSSLEIFNNYNEYGLINYNVDINVIKNYYNEMGVNPLNFTELDKRETIDSVNFHLLDLILTYYKSSYQDSDIKWPKILNIFKNYPIYKFMYYQGIIKNLNEEHYIKPEIGTGLADAIRKEFLERRGKILKKNNVIKPFFKEKIEKQNIKNKQHKL